MRRCLALLACLTIFLRSDAAAWQSLFDGATLAGWKSTEFAGHGEVEVESGALVLNQGMLTGINYTNALPTTPYELELEARRVLGNDFFMGLTFPVGPALCTWINGGWGGAVVGLSSIDGADASQNATTKYRKFVRDQWYRFRLRVTLERITAWIDDEQVIDEDIRGKSVALRPGEIEQSAPFGFAAYNTRAELRKLRWRSLVEDTAPPKTGPGAKDGKVLPATDPAVVAALTRDCAALVKAAEQDAGRIHARLATWCDRFGPRLAGSSNHEAALTWLMEELKSDGLEAVRSEPVMVPYWERGLERAELRIPGKAGEALPVLGFGGTVATPPGGLVASVLVVTNLTELTNRAAEARGRIVVFDVPFTQYGETVRFRSMGAVAAAKVGAVASAVSTIGPVSLRTPHTGMMGYEGAERRIPHVSLTAEDTGRLRRWQERGVTPQLFLETSGRFTGEVPSRNVLAEIRGREHPGEIVVLGAHSDSWDVGQGAQDDGGGVLAAWEALHLIQRLGLKPRRTLRLVLWTHEEAGGSGARAYRDAHRAELANHVFALEADSGTFAPRGLDFTGSDAGHMLLRPLAQWLGERLSAGALRRGGAPVDVAPLLGEGVPVGGLRVANDRYFWFHHTAADTVDKVDPADLAGCTGLMASIGWWIAEHPERLAR